MQTIKNYGLNLELEKQHISEEDHVFGALSQPELIFIPANEREKYLPKGEIQNKGEDKFDCASRGPLNILEAKFTYALRNHKFSKVNEQWLRDNGYIRIYFKNDETEEEVIEFSDCFVAQNSDTKPGVGNSLIKPLHAIHAEGLIPKAILPQCETAAEYYDPKRITPSMVRLGADFAARFTINYERVNAIHYKHLLQEDLIIVAGYAWPTAIEGIYPRSDNVFNHCFILLKFLFAFDNYIDPFDSDFIKNLATDFNFLDYGYRVFISAETTTPAKKNWLVDLFARFRKVFSGKWINPVPPKLKT